MMMIMMMMMIRVAIWLEVILFVRADTERSRGGNLRKSSGKLDKILGGNLTTS